ncbi:FAD/FMN-containing dehydrogenase [Tistlia consotensis]|uniref:FAD/FMN-containing dehydrogenase n=1 Tax=Tistlia consotensis USBA 355 TaxID=560819 RepID=A0A1Y6BA94_9PROT|nr:FAD-binding oxidoreductase [Tistlia consotensis]SME97456.1 FAD/FMN-containing dehydrogenase [Tistlia consotensis USBA 355]SNR56809.1 FAD/FMN-containing dehydrogenase [Tistlia consotensis]
MSDQTIERLRGRLGDRGLLTEPAAMAPFLTDWRGREEGRALCVALPASTEEVAAVVAIAAAAGLPLFPQGGNTGLCYGAVPRGGAGPGIVVALQRMNRIREIDRAANVMTVDAGVVLDAAHAAAAEVGRQVPLYLGSQGSAQIGGLISTNAGGTGVIRYGPMRELVCGLEVVLADGRVLCDLEALKKNNTGYDLKQLFIGAEGTLGIVTGAALRLHPAMAADAHAWVALATPADALSLLSRLQDRFDTAILACELLSRSEVDLVLAEVERTRCPFAETPPWTLMIELGSADPEAPLGERLQDLLATALEDGLALDAMVAASRSQAEDIWRVRHSVSEANRAGFGLTHDVAVRVSKVPAFIAAADRLLAERFPDAVPVVVAHLGDGNVHYIAMFQHAYWRGLNDPKATVAEVQTRLHDLAAGFGGSISAEHGIGRKLTGELARLGDPLRYELMAGLKRLLDPDDRLNPGVLLARPS